MWRRLLLAGSAAALLFVLGGAEGFDEDELACEDAVAHLIDCCPDDAPARAVSCYAGRGCDETRPQLSNPRASCLRDADCDALYASGACEQPTTASCP